MRRQYGMVVVILMAAMVFTLCSAGYAVEVGGKAPDFTLPDAGGKDTAVAPSEGKVIILNFFASWCPPCRQEIPDFIKLQDKYGAQGVTVIGVSLVSPEETKAFVAKMGINYPVLVDDGKASALYGPVRSIPTTFVIGKDGKIAKMYIGLRSKEVFEADIKELIR